MKDSNGTEYDGWQMKNRGWGQRMSKVFRSRTKAWDWMAEHYPGGRNAGVKYFRRLGWEPVKVRIVEVE